MVADACVPSGAAQWDALRILATLGIEKLLRKPKINRVEYVSLLVDSHQKVVWLDIAMEEALRMDVFDSGDGLVGDKEDCFERESSAAVVE